MAKRRGHGEGSIYQDNRGRWVAEIDLGRDANGKRRRPKRIARTRLEARQRLKELQADAAAHLDIEGSNVTIGDLLERVIENARSKGRQPKTIDNYEWAASHIRPTFGSTRAREVTALQIEAHLGRLVEERNLSRSSLARILRTLRQALDEGIRHDWLTRNVATVARCPDSHTAAREALTVEQVRLLVAAADGTRLHAPVVVGVTCGLRPGELLGLTWANLNLEISPSTLTVSQSLKHDRTGTYLGDVKTATSRRTIALTEATASALKSHRTRQNRERLAAGPGWVDHNLVFANELGRPWDPSNFRRDFQVLTSAAGLGKVAPYAMRHTAVTLLSEEGVPAEQIADLVGHRDTRMVERVYRHRGAYVDVGRSELMRVLADEPASCRMPRA
ncbi:MAG: tyrosine-type recombinase/integrase [Actinomycetota bacterium]